MFIGDNESRLESSIENSSISLCAFVLFYEYSLMYGIIIKTGRQNYELITLTVL